MKIFKLTSISILSLLFLCTACSKDNDSSPSGANLAGEGYLMTATIDGEAFSTDNVNVSAEADISDIYTIIGVSDNGEWISFSLDGPPSTGTFSPAPGETTSLGYLQVASAVWGAEGNIGSGSVTITENTSSFIKGTFSFVGANPADTSNTISVNEGSFKAQKL